MEKLINEMLANLKNNNMVETSEISDSYHTFGELYHHRAVLFSVILNQNSEFAWKSRLHDDGTMFDDMFVVGIETPKGNYTYHYHLKYWDMFRVKDLDRAPEWDGHTANDVDRLFYL